MCRPEIRLVRTIPLIRTALVKNNPPGLSRNDHGYSEQRGVAEIVERLDRLAREYMVQEQLLVYLAAKGISIYNAATGENITEAVKSDPMKKAVIQIQGVFAELEKSLLVKRLARARERKRVENGKCEGKKGWNDTEPERKAEILKIVKAMRRKTRNGARPCRVIKPLLIG